MAAAVVSILRLPLSATVITLLLVSKAGLATAPLIIVAVVVAYLTIQTLSPARGPAPAAAPAAAPQPAAPPHPRRNRKPGRYSDMTTGHHDRGQRLARGATPSPGAAG